MKKLESELKNTDPQIYKDGSVLPSFADALRIMFENTKPLLDILSDTICTTDLERNHRFTEQLLLTGFPEDIQEILLSLSYDKRKEMAREADSITRFFESEHRQLEKAIKYLNTPEFSKIDSVLDGIKQLYDICKFPYITALRIFDHEYISGGTPNFQAAPVELLESQLEELYYVTYGLSLSKSTCNAICALHQLRTNTAVSEEYSAKIEGHLKKIQSLVHQVFTSAHLKGMIQISKKDPNYEPKKAIYREESRRKYAEFLETRFQADGQRLKGELQDETISNELHQLFSNSTMVPVVGYNFELNNLLVQSSPTAFQFVMPMQILKNFIAMYYTEHVKPLLNDIVIEGYFSNPAYKSEFSSYVYALNEASERIAHFEKKFQRNEEFDESVITSLIRDSHKDNIFVGRLKELVDKINKTAKDLIQNEVGSVFHVYKICGDILVETKKAHSETIENLKVLMLSSRNQKNTETLEKQHPLWSVFLEIMRNYVIITTVDKK
ncbi:MAG: hypothetical protein II563_00085 [Treponema sp.]|nr:hypothetical protein [Treponema sp.]MBQ4235234.1 hypothetical protein [Treponema sp.]